MKRGMGGGTFRGPLGALRQRRTIRLVQILLVVVGVSLGLFAIYSVPNRSPSQAITLAVLAVVSAISAWLLADGPSVRVPTPARLEELAGRAENVAIEKASEPGADA